MTKSANFSIIKSKKTKSRLVAMGPFLVAGLLFSVSWLLLLFNNSFVIDIGADNHFDQIYLDTGTGGFFQPEKQPSSNSPVIYDTSYRWTGQVAIIKLPWPLNAVPHKVTLQATAPRPGRPPDQAGTSLIVSDLTSTHSQNLGSYPVPGIATGTDIVFLVPGHFPSDLSPSNLRFETTETFQPGKGDTRNLSAIFFNLKVETDYAAFGLRFWFASLIIPFLLGLLMLATWGLAGLFTSRPTRRIVIEMVAGLLLVAGLVATPQEIIPFLGNWTLILVVSWLVLKLAGNFASAALCLPAPFIYCASLLPVFPLAQFAFGRLDFTTVNSGSLAFGLYLAALVSCIVIYLVARVHFEIVFITVFLGAASLVFAFNHWQIFEYNLRKGADFLVYYRRLIAVETVHQPLYNIQEMLDYPGFGVRMPPAFTVLLWPFAQLFGRNEEAALLAWRLANELLLIPIFLLLLRIFSKARMGLRLWPAITFTFLAFDQIGETLGYGQFHILLLFGIILTAFCLKKQRDDLGGLALAMPIWLKLFPVVTALFFVSERSWRRFWRAALGLGAGAVLMNVLTIAVVGWDNLWFYYSKAIYNVNNPELGIVNQSWWGFIGRLAVNEVQGNFGNNYPTGLAPLCYLIALLSLGLNGFVLWRVRSEDWLVQQLKFGSLILLALLISPLSWPGYILTGLVLIVAMLVKLTRKDRSCWQLVVFAVAYGLLAYGGPGDLIITDEAVGLARVTSSYRFLATLTLWLLSLWQIWSASTAQIQIPETEVPVPKQGEYREGVAGR